MCVHPLTYVQEHHNNCKYGIVPCPNSTYGCKVQLTRSKVQQHLKLDCQFNPVTCRYCGKHTTNEEVSRYFLFLRSYNFIYISGSILD